MVVYHQVTEGDTLPSSAQKGFCMYNNVNVFPPSIYRPALLLENYQPWLDLKVPSKVDASLSEVIHA